MLNGVMQMPAVRAWRDSRFETVMVNVDRFNVNMDIPARYGVTVRQIPTVLVLTPQGKLLDPGRHAGARPRPRHVAAGVGGPDRRLGRPPALTPTGRAPVTRIG